MNVYFHENNDFSLQNYDIFWGRIRTTPFNRINRVKSLTQIYHHIRLFSKDIQTATCPEKTKKCP